MSTRKVRRDPGSAGSEDEQEQHASVTPLRPAYAEPGFGKPTLGYADPVEPESEAVQAERKALLGRKIMVTAVAAAIAASMIAAGLVVLILL